MQVFTMPFVYFKTDTSKTVGFACIPDGRINFSELGQEFGFSPTSIKLNSYRFSKEGPKSVQMWEQIEELFRGAGKPVGAEDDPVMVTGEAPDLAGSTEEEALSKLDEKLNHVIAELKPGHEVDIFKLMDEMLKHVIDKLKLVEDLVRMSHDMFLRCQFAPTGASEKFANYRQKAISRYICAKSERDSGKLFCSVTGLWFKKDVVVAGHIFMKKWPAFYLEEIFGLKIHSPENILFHLDCVGERFDSFELCVIPEGGDTFRTKVLNPAICSLTIHSDTELTFGDLNDRLLSFTTIARPAKRMCGFRVKLALKHAEGKGWIEQGVVVVPDEVSFDRKLMTSFLGDVNPEDGLDGLGGGLEGGGLEGDLESNFEQAK